MKLLLMIILLAVFTGAVQAADMRVTYPTWININTADKRKVIKEKQLIGESFRIDLYTADTALHTQLKMGQLVTVKKAKFSKNRLRMLVDIVDDNGKEIFDEMQVAGKLGLRDLDTWNEFEALAKSACAPEEFNKTALEDKLLIGMKSDCVRLTWGYPNKVNRTTTANGVSEQWIYYRNGTFYLYMKNGVLTAAQN